MPPPPARKSSPLVPLLIVGAIAVVMLMAGAAAAILIVLMNSGALLAGAADPRHAARRAGSAARRAAGRPRPGRRHGRRPGAAAIARAATARSAGRRAHRADRREEPVRAVERAVRVGGQIKAPTKIRNVQPVYPQIAQSARVQGVVIIEATIDPSGKVANTRVLRSIPLLDQAALDAVRKWEYEPTLLNGVAVPVIMTVTVNFTLR